MRWFAAAAVAAFALGVGAGVLAARGDETRTVVRTQTVRVWAPVDGKVAVVQPGVRVALRSRPGGPLVRTVGPRTEFGSRETLLPTGASRGPWIAVRHTSLGNTGTAWIDRRKPGVELVEGRVAIEVDLSQRELVVDGAGAKRRIPVAIGAPDTPTPPGQYYVTDKLPGPDFGAFYGCCILALSGRQPNLPQGWSGGDRLAIHGSPTPTWGKNVSNGCLHAAEADLRWLMRTVPLGTPVEIRP